MTPEEARRRFKPNDPCICGSGVRYKFCHQAALEARPDKVLPAAHAQYVKAWASNAGHFEARGYYADLANEIQSRGARRVLDVGCGLGHGLTALLDCYPSGELSLIGLDGDPNCIDAAAAKLAAHADQPKVIKRIRCVPVPGQRLYDLAYETGKLGIGPADKVALIQSDLTDDPELVGFLAGLPRFDAVTLWFAGVHTARQGLRRLNGENNEAKTRALLESATFSLARRILRPGGVVHIAVRGAASNLDDILSARAEQIQLAAPGFKVVPLSARAYSEPTNFNRVGMVVRGLDIRGLPVTPAIISVVAEWEG